MGHPNEVSLNNGHLLTPQNEDDTYMRLIENISTDKNALHSKDIKHMFLNYGLHNVKRNIYPAHLELSGVTRTDHSKCAG